MRKRFRRLCNQQLPVTLAGHTNAICAQCCCKQHTWLSQQDGVVLCAPAKDLDHAGHLTLTTNHLHNTNTKAQQ